MFSVQKGKFGKFNQVKLVNDDTGEHFTLIPGYGATLNELVLNKNGRNYSIVDGVENPSELIRNEWFKSAKLTPYPNRISKGKYSFGGKSYRLPINFAPQKHAIHGLVFNQRFQLKKVKKASSSISADLEYTYRKEIPGYPFSFKVILTWSLTKKGLKCSTTIRNICSETMPMGDGWHPYLRLTEKVDSLFLKISANTKVDVDEKMVPTRKTSRFDKFSTLSPIGGTRLDTGFVINEKGKVASSELYSKANDVKIVLWQETGKGKYNYLQVFIPPSRTSIAIEPMTCATDAFNNKMGLILLKPGEEFTGAYGIYLS